MIFPLAQQLAALLLPSLHLVDGSRTQGAADVKIQAAPVKLTRGSRGGSQYPEAYIRCEQCVQQAVRVFESTHASPSTSVQDMTQLRTLDP